MSITRLTLALIVTGLSLPIFSQTPAGNPQNPNRQKVKPLFDFPLRHTHILPVGKSTWYMTGTLSNEDKGTDFQNNNGIRLWKSTDLKSWQDLGLVWDIDKQGSPWQKVKRINKKDPTGPKVRGITAPEILQIKDNYYIAYSMNGHGCGLLKSTTQSPEGPYEDLGQITATGGDASMFQDTDGTVYFIWGNGKIAPLNDDLTAIKGETKQLLSFVKFNLDTHGGVFLGTGAADPVNPHGFRVQIVDYNGGKKQYFMTFAAESCRAGVSMMDTFATVSDKLFGTYKYPDIAITNGGQATIFKTGNNDWFGTFYGEDAHAEFTSRPALLPLNNRHGTLTNERSNVFTERGPWDTVPFCRPEARINDAMCLAAPDGCYYLTGSNWDPELFNKVTIYKSKDIKEWTRHTVFDFMDIPWVAETKKKFTQLLERTGKGKGSYGGGTAWSLEIHYLNGQYYIPFLFADRGVPKEVREDMYKLHKGNKCVIITSKNPLGPYKYHTSIGCSMPSFLEEEDGTIYMTMGAARKMKPDMTGFAEEERPPKPETFQKEGLIMSYDPIGSYMIKIGDKYIFGSENLLSGYDGQCFVGDSPRGPWSRPRVHMPHGGHAGMFKGHDGKYYSVMWYAFNTFCPTIMPLHVEVKDDDVIIMPEYEWEHLQKK